MALLTNRVTVGDEPTLIRPATGAGREVLVYNASDASVFLGGVAVTTSTGFTLPVEETIRFRLGPDDALYGIAAAADKIVHVLSA